MTSIVFIHRANLGEKIFFVDADDLEPLARGDFVARKSFKAGALSAPLPPVLVTVSDGERTNVLTIAWTGILATHPPRTYISVRPSRYSYEILKKSGEFVINLPSADMAKTVDFIGIYTGKKIDKLERCGLSTIPSEVVSVPTLADCAIALECRVAEVLPMGTHDVFIADILSVSADERIIDENGRLCFERADLLAYAHGEYFALGEKLGEFGFSTKKEKPEGGKKRSASLPSGKGSKKKKEPHGKKSQKDGGTGIERAVSAEPDDGATAPFYVSAPGYKKKRGGRR